MKRTIGISYTRTNFHYYLDWFADEANEFELVVLSFEKNNIEDVFRCDGFLLTGGVDIHPCLYGGDEGYKNATLPLEPERDAFEKKIYHYAKLHRLPVLAICRGLELVNVLEGGKLVQDLAEDNSTHCKETRDKQHDVLVVPGSLLEHIVNEKTGAVNSAHHQAVDENFLPSTLRVTARAGDVIEALEFTDAKTFRFFLGVQWHPERMEKATSPFSKNIRSAFLNSIKMSEAKHLEVINPATEELITRLNADAQTSLQNKLVLLQQGQRKWKRSPLEKRIAAIMRFSDLLLQEKEHLAAVLSSEMGKPLQQSKNEIEGARKRIKWLAEHSEKYLADEMMSNENGMQEKISYEPLGVVCNISAWNYPYLVGVNVFVPALIAGNAVMYKPSEYTSLTGIEIDKLLKKAGVPEDVFQPAIGGPDVGEILLGLSFDGYFFTGSYKTGRHIYQNVAAKMVPCQCELGGKDPLYVADDVDDVKAVAAATADGAFYNNGQSCCAVERIYVHENIYDDYVNAFKSEVEKFKIGSPLEEGVYIGPLSRPEQINFLEQQVNEAVSKGATLITGGKRIDRKGFYFQPTVLTNVDHSMQVMKEESFGPVIGIMKVTGDDEALQMMQDTEYGLTASVYSRNQQRAEKILDELNTGTGYWNCCDRVSAALPWSGRKNSGVGATLSHVGIRAFTKPKAYHLRSE